MFLGSSWYKPGSFLKTDIIIKKNISPGALFMRKKKEMISGNT